MNEDIHSITDNQSNNFRGSNSSYTCFTTCVCMCVCVRAANSGAVFVEVAFLRSNLTRPVTVCWNGVLGAEAG